MTIADLLLVLAVLAAVVTLVAAGLLAWSGRGRASLRILRGLAVAVVGYLALGLCVAFLRPQRVMSVGEPWCFDDWCLAVRHVSAAPTTSGITYTVALELSSRARRVSQRARGAWVYLINDRGVRYRPDANPSAVPLDVLLGPGDSVATTRTFHVPSDVGSLGLITGHGGPYCGPMDLLVIGASGCVFRKPPMIRIR